MISIVRLARMAIRIADWATPHIQAWRRRRAYHFSEAQRHLAARNWTEAEEHLHAALEERHHSPARVLDLVLWLCEVQRNLGQAEEAEKSARTAVELAVAARDAGAQARALEAAAEVEISQERYADATSSLDGIERLERSRSKPELPRIARAARRRSSILRATGRPAEARQALERAVEIYRTSPGSFHRETGDCWAELGALFSESGDHEAAQRALRSALDAHRAGVGDDSMEAARDLVELARSLESSGQYEAAIVEFERTLKLKERHVGGKPEDKAETQARLAALYVKARRTAAARELLFIAIPVLERQPDHRLAAALETQAEIEDQLGNAEGAVLCRERAAALTR